MLKKLILAAAVLAVSAPGELKPRIASCGGTSRTTNARPLVPIPGQLPPPGARPPGCNFGPRCTDFRHPHSRHGIVGTLTTIHHE